MHSALKDAVDKLELQREKWKGLLHNTNTAESSAFQATDQQLKNSVKKVEQDIKNIKKTVKHVEKNRNQYPHIDDAELKSREDFISRTKKVRSFPEIADFVLKLSIFFLFCVIWAHYVNCSRFKKSRMRLIHAKRKIN